MNLVNPFMSFGTFSPASIAGLKLWLKTDSLSLNDGDSVTAWTDSSGNGNNITSVGTFSPVFKTNIINGLPVVRFDGTDQRLALTTAFTSTTNSIFAVFKETATRFIVLGAAASSTFFGSAYSINFLLWRNNSDAGLTLADTNPSAFVQVTGINSAGSAQMWRNKISKGTGTVGAALSYGHIGHRAGAGDQFSTGDLTEIIYYDSALSSANQALVEAYLGSKYGLF